ncbi:hypothetical protein AX16_004758 [Volvariella volvacea WC 439]|nr:hypothetical protein AX16_004758 [Volvariella volvacea WC 439]
MIKAASVSPSKGKAKDETHWHAGWWDFQPLGDHVQRPVQWSNSGVIFTAHPTEPLLTGRYFSSNKTFILPSPQSVTSSSYESPTLISVAPTDLYLFAYFPGHEGGGLGCLWKRGPQVDRWNLNQWWDYAPNTAPIAAAWLGAPREWVPTQHGLSRLAPRGPLAPAYEAILLLVTEDRCADIHYLRNYEKAFKILKCPLEYTGTVDESRPVPPSDPMVGTSCMRRSLRAAVGLGYNETSIMIAIRNQRLPLQHISPPFDPMNLGLPMNVHFPDDSPCLDWESFGEEATIELYELQLQFSGYNINVQSLPLLPIHRPGTLSNLVFACVPYPSNEAIRMATPQKNSILEKGRLFLAVSTLEFDFTSVPLSDLTVYSFTHDAPVSVSLGRSSWTVQRESAMQTSPDVLAFVLPRTSPVPLLLVGLLHTSTNQQGPARPKEISNGVIKALTLPELKEHPDWKSVPLLSKPEHTGRRLPVYAASSPNYALVCTRLSSLWPTQTLIQTLPGPPKILGAKPPLATTLASAVLARRSLTDITHILSSSSWSLEEVQDVFYHAIATLDSNHNGQSALLTSEMLGVGVDIYRRRELHAQDRESKQALREAWQAAHDICSLVSYHYAFEECRDGDGYDDEALWQLVQLCSWVMRFTEKLMQQCILSAGLDADQPRPSSTPMSDVSAHVTRPDSPILLHLSHPFALINLITCIAHVKRLHDWLSSKPNLDEKARTAKKCLSDLVESSGINLTALEHLLKECTEGAMKLNLEELRKGLAACRPTGAMHLHLIEVLRKMIHSAVLDKATLFLKPAELVDGMSRMSIGSQRHERIKDVVTRGSLPDYPTHSTCLRCGGKTEEDLTGDRERLTRWKAWERLWTLRCICGGPWGSGLP